MQVDPHAWFVTAPLTISLVQFHFQPSDYIIKRWWRQLNEMEALAWARLGCREPMPASGVLKRSRTLMFSAIVVGLAATSLASFSAFVGFIPAG